MYYKYLPIERITYFENELLRFSQAADLNDPFECLPQKPQREDLYDTIRLATQIFTNGNSDWENHALEKFNDEWIDNFYKNAYTNINRDIGILSLSKNWKSSLMWAHYTVSHRGFCIGFDENHDFFKDFLSSDKNTSRYTKDVLYSEKRAKIPTSLSEPTLTFEPFLTKSIEWAYENEVRVIATLNSASSVITTEPYNICLFKVPHTALKEIILGVNIDSDSEKKIREFAEKSNIEIFKTKISETEFDMERI
ncbi:DUF2971 domain-containing protein [Chryseobacterium sp.]|uniref:DUF2971 domain-containing protein n=1 Tax=Chryseobacterium sp. TaxID=1871047 RepID=UPI0024E1B56E|nr:DUF2971 domain-containing protein [Chryseobacterium sp.]